MTKREYDVAVIGSGPGGYVAAIRAAQLGYKTVCIEKEKTLGGTCLNVGCIPSKALLQSTEYYSWLCHESQVHGIACVQPSIDFSKMMSRKSQIVKGLVTGIASLFAKNGIARIEGSARFISPHAIEVDCGGEKRQIEAEHFILATGSESIPLPFLPFDEKLVVSSTGALRLPVSSQRLVVVGAGVIGVELASVYNRLGSEVTVVEMMDCICPAMDLAMSKALLQSLKKQGIAFHLGAKVLRAVQKDGATTLHVQHEQRELEITGDVVLVAVGRRPYSKGLGIAEIGIAKTEKGFVAVDGNFRTSLPHIYAIGDLIEGPMLAHRASEEGVAVAEIIAGQAPHINYMAIPNVVYTHPEVAAIGVTEQEAHAFGVIPMVGQAFFKGNPRARCSGDAEGFVKVIGAAPSGQLVGMHIIGPHASEMIGEGVIALEKRATLQDIAGAPHAHPTLSEAIKEACLDALGRAIHAS